MTVIQVTPTVYQISDRRANMFLLVEDDLTLIDAGFRSSVDLVLDQIQKIGGSPKSLTHLILTHNHLDHIGGAFLLKKTTGCRIAANSVDFDTCHDQLPYKGGKQLAKLLQAPILTPIRRRLLLDNTSIDIPLDSGNSKLYLNNLQIIFTPGHTPGSISVYHPQQKILFVGDSLNKRKGLPLKSVSLNREQAVTSALLISEMDVDIICFGHGKPILKNSREYLQKVAAKANNSIF